MPRKIPRSYATMDPMSRLRAALQERILVLDGAMGTGSRRPT